MYVEYAEAFSVGYMDQAGRYLQLFVTTFLFFILRGNFLYSKVALGIRSHSLCYVSAFKKKYTMVSSSDSSLLLFLSL